MYMFLHVSGSRNVAEIKYKSIKRRKNWLCLIAKVIFCFHKSSKRKESITFKLLKCADIAGTPATPPTLSPWVEPSKNWVTCGYQKFCYKGRITLKEAGGWWRNGGSPLSYYFTVQLHLLCVGEKVVFFITFWFFCLLSWTCKILIQVFIVLDHCIICIFLIHSDSVQRKSTALFKLVWNTQKSTWTNFKCQGKVFHNIENVLVS